MRAIFSPSEEDRLKAEFFQNTAGPGFYVDVGANEPVDGSQTVAFDRLGWKGILVEPQPDYTSWLKAERSGTVFAVACTSPDKATGTMTLHVAQGGHASLLPDYYIAGFKGRQLTKVEVPVRTLDSLLEEVGAPTPINFVSLDVEFHEIEVLDGFDLKRWKPQLILIEDVASGFTIHNYLRARGYKWVRRTGLNAWYVPEDHPMSVSLFGRWQFLRKHVLGVPFRRLRDAKRRLLQQ
jgi:FkbM family methyltransferase